MINHDETLKALYSKVRERKILVYDLESKDGDSQNIGLTRVFMAGVYDGERFITFRNHPILSSMKDWSKRAVSEGGCIDQCMRYLLTREFRGHYIYAHNGGAFDHLHILPWLTEHISEYAYTIIPVQSSIQMLKIKERSSKQVWTFLDSIRLIPMGLDQIAKTFGFGGKVEHDLALHEDDPAWQGYLEGDCVKLYDSLEKFQRFLVDDLGGELGITTPSTAMKLYRRRYMGHGKTPALIDQHRHFKECDGVGSSPLGTCNACMHDWIRRGYYGGRTECFRSQGKGLSYYDINSSYPRAMLEDMPGGVVKQYGPKKTVTDFHRIERDAVGFIECEVYIPRTCYIPPLPYRDKQRGKLIFPSGTFSGVWPWDELKLLFDSLVLGKITRVVRSVWYQKKSLFFDFVKELYTYRDKDSASYDEGLSLIAKLMMNSLYGKFGMNEDRREILVLAKGERPPEGATLPSFEDGNEDLLSQVCFIEKHVSPPYILPQISAQITALARIRLWRFMASVIRRGGRLYYCDTDSIITDCSDLPVSANLGELKNEFPGEVLDVEIAGLKMYMLKKEKAFPNEHEHGCPKKGCSGCSRVKLAMKGIPREKRTEDTLRLLKNGAKVEFGRLEKLGAMAVRGFRYSPRVTPTHKRHVAKYDKREFIDDGADSTPVYIEKTTTT